MTFHPSVSLAYRSSSRVGEGLVPQSFTKIIHSIHRCFQDGLRRVATVFVHATNLLWAKDALYVADTFNNAIRKIDPAIGATVSTLAGGTGRGFQDCPGSSARFLWPRGLAVHEGTLYVTEEGNSSAVHGGSQQFTHQLKYQLSTVTAPHAGPFQVSPPIIVP